ncbi:MAG TPA: hypothetical protein VMA83_01965 [Solirubrobacteraceae bacterium]|nr:hypothetical protein [Solirubrobacteraceae bacterium]
MGHAKFSPALLPSAGGHAKLTFKAKHASKCSLKSSLRFVKVPRSVKCSHGTAHVTLRVPRNASRAVESVTITITAKRGHHAAHKKLTLQVLGAPELALGVEFGCELINGKVYCWGEDFEGQLGRGTVSAASPTPAQVTLPARAVQVGAGYSAACALLATGQVYCWGNDERGVVGQPPTPEPIPKPTLVAGLTGAKSLSMGDGDACVVLRNASAECWGNDETDQAGNGNSNEEVLSVYTPTTVIGVSNVVSLAVSEKSTCAVIKGGTVKCWGDGELGQLGDGKLTADVVVTTPVSAIVSGVTQLAASWYDFCAVTSGHQDECWGGDQLGEADDGATGAPVETPAVAHGLGPVSYTGQGTRTLCAISDGHVFCWGYGENGQLGNGETRLDAASAVEAQGITTAADVASGESDSCAVLVNETTDCWGENERGAVGDGTTGERVTTPTPVTGLP